MVKIKNYNLGNYPIPKECNRDVCVDIGANVGSFFMKNKDRFDLIHFYEVYKPVFEICMEKSIPYSHISGFNTAVYHSDGQTVEIVNHNNNDAGSLAIKSEQLNDEWQTEIIQECSTISLESIIDRVGGHINYLKSDCETSEYNLFMNKDLSSIDYIGIELHHQMGKYKFDKLVQYMKKTHKNISGDITWTDGKNKEVLFKNKNIK